MALLAAIFAAATAFLLTYTLVTPSRAKLAFVERLNRYERGTDPERAAKLAQPFTMRVLAPTAGRLRRFGAALLPASLARSVERQLLAAGEPVSLQFFLVLQFLAGFAGLALALTFLARDLPPLLRIAGIAAGAALALMPLLWLRMKIRRRAQEILRALPDTVDLIVTSVEAGMSIDAALAEVGQDTKGPLGEELRLAVRETALGRSRREALLGIVERNRVPELRAFIQSIIQAEQTGIPLGQVLRSQAAHVRLQRRQRAEVQAQRAPVKMVVILVTLVLPAMLLMIIGPALLRMRDSI